MYELADDDSLCIDDEDEPRTALLFGFSLDTEWETPNFGCCYIVKRKKMFPQIG